jgi:manganese transport protein
LVQTRKIKRDNLGIKRALRLNFFDSAIALNIAFFVNAFILILAATVFFKTGRTEVGQIKQAHELLSPLLGSVWAPRLFAIALIASGQSSTITGTLAGQIIMEGYLHLRITPWVRRLLTRLIAVVPAVLVILLSGESNVDNLLILSQVVLSIQLGFAIIPLIHLTSNKKTMGLFAIKPLTIVAASFITALLVYLNLRMVIEQSVDFFNSIESIIPKILIVIAGIMYVVLLFVAIFYPFKKKEGIISEASEVHPEAIQISTLSVPQYKTIVVALDFSINDYKLIAHALGQGIETSNYVLIHVVESAATRIIGNESDDLETRKDQVRLNEYVEDLKLKGFHAIGLLGFDNRVKEIVRLANENNADILVIGAHGHSGLKDVILGHTVEDVRHELRIPILVINI